MTILKALRLTVRSRCLRTTLVTTIGLLILAVAAASALAAPYKYEKEQSEELSKTVPGGAFVDPSGLTFDAAGNLYVADPLGNAGQGVIDKFNDENVFQAPLGEPALTGERAESVAVNDETGHVYVSGPNGGELIVLNAAGEELSRWTGANTPSKAFSPHVVVSVDNSSGPSKGDVYVLVRGNGNGEGATIDVFEPKNGDKEEGKLVRTFEPPEGFAFEGNGESLTVDAATGQVYVVESSRSHQVVYVFSAAGALEREIEGPTPSKKFAEPIAVAVDGSTGDVFVIDHGDGHLGYGAEVVYKLSPTGQLLAQIKETGANEPLEGPVGLAVQQTGPHAGELYVTDAVKKAIDVFAEQVPAAPKIESEGVSQLFSDSASLDAAINPEGATTEYRFEYGQCSGAEGIGSCASSPYTQSVPVPDASLGFEDFTTHSVSPVSVTGLTAGATYHFRVVAHNKVDSQVNTVEGEARTFTTQTLGGASELPDGRVWELVSPPEKQGALIGKISTSGIVEAATNGSAVTYLTSEPTELELAGYANSVNVLSTRGPGGWSSHDLVIAHAIPTGESVPEYRFFSEDLSMAVVQPLGAFDPQVSAEASEQTPYLRTLGSCTESCFRPLVTGRAGFANVPVGTPFGEDQPCEQQPTKGQMADCGPTFWDATPDARHAVLSSAAPLEPGLPRNELYEWTEGALSLISVLPPNGKGEELPAPSGSTLPSQPLLGAHFGSEDGAARRAISNDGSRVYWESESVLYMRDLATHQTLQIDASEPACLEETSSKCMSGGGHFQIANVEGSRVYFTDEHRLTRDAGANPGEPDLYECQVGEVAGKLACEKLTDLTPLTSGKAVNVLGEVLGSSEDGSTVYFVADGILDETAGAVHGNCESQPVGPRPNDTCNLYALHPGSPAKLVAVLSGSDQTVWNPESIRPERVSPDGSWLAFMSARSLTDYDNRDAVSGQPDAEVYLYNATANHLSCASCNPSGARPAGVEYEQLESGASETLPGTTGEWGPADWVSALLPRTTSLTDPPIESAYQSRYLSNSGRLFFNSDDALVPQDVNGTGDVYEFEPPGVGGCSTSSPQFAERSGGCVGLISSGTSPEESSFLDASESGDNVFFRTSERLTSGDVDSLRDVYDAHECSAASPCTPTAPATPPACVTEASCKAAPSPQPAIFGAPASATFSGAGNLAPAGTKVVVKSLTRAQKLAKALAVCHREKKKAKRSKCEKAAQKKYGAVKKAKKKAKQAA
jgi:hypothetical protein